MGKYLIVAVTLFALGLTACANSENKWAKEESTASSNTQSKWQQDEKADDAQKKSASTYWNDGNRY